MVLPPQVNKGWPQMPPSASPMRMYSFTSQHEAFRISQWQKWHGFSKKSEDEVSNKGESSARQVTGLRQPWTQLLHISYMKRHLPNFGLTVAPKQQSLSQETGHANCNSLRMPSSLQTGHITAVKTGSQGTARL